MITTAPVAGASPYYDRLYRLLSRRRVADLGAYAGLCTAVPTRVLDLAGGAGRVARHLAARGHFVTVVDSSADMLDGGRAASTADPAAVVDRLDWILADIATPIHDLPLAWYQVAICAHHAINELLDDVDGVFANAAAHLEREGVLAIAALSEVPYPRPWTMELLDAFDTDEGTQWIVTTSVVPDATDPRRHLLFTFYDEFRDGVMTARHARSTQRRVWTRAELIATAERNGLTVQADARADGLLVFTKASRKEVRV